jgi:chromosomal replication initiation ATPase DnaA
VTKEKKPEHEKLPPSGASAKEVLARVTELKLLTLVKNVADKRHCSVMELLSGSRAARIQAARVDLYKALRDKGWSYSDIGGLVSRNHSTIVIALKGRTRKAQKAVAQPDNG